MEFSRRILSMQYSPIRKLVPLIDKAKKEGVTVYELHIGQPDVKTPDTFFEGLNNFKENIVKYANSAGIMELRESFSKSYKKSGIDISPDDMLITHGGSEAIQITLQTICNPGDEVLIPEPYYTNYDSFLKTAEAVLIPIETVIDNHYHLPVKEEIEKLITPKTKAIMFSNPSNPTGIVLTPKEMEIIKEIALKYDLYIIADEVYRQFIYDDDLEYQSFMTISEISDRTVLIDSISKHYSACGARIGVLASKNKQFIAQALKLCQARLSVSTIEQIASANLINTLDTYIDNVRLEYKVRRDMMYNHLKEMPGVISFRPDSAFYIFAELPVDDIEKFIIWLLKEFRYKNQTLSFATGPGFYSKEGNGKKEARFSFCTHNLTEIENGMKVLKKALEEYNRAK
ncbi:pyridoxal phosphate-dependent aminotransferase [Leptotrichia sp. OH3620_COT-345]|uniref:pyridoxal phosphate-dependent aminotransferase n=1 Tax=Leptotrichia sp. OH3620_COT-345 TaxID=2491048 RepID=UPI000F64A2B9|nr:pyridoxal phosphate-dependent aminotransferase [Leptotrichia sp. OH3620_COT-345]RRD41106.1 pyridoxal phosphate-dependent aminotransferase [Leptotrichia sp. OH3620_COT-345]